jgi:hypothetical protein
VPDGVAEQVAHQNVEGRAFNKNLGGELRWMTQFDGGQNRSNYVAFILRHDFGWSADHPGRRVRFLPQ